MPRYYFHVRGDTIHHDLVGIELSNIKDAKFEAWSYAIDLLDASVVSNFEDEWWIEVTDASGEMLFRLDTTTWCFAGRSRIERRIERRLH